MSGVDPEIFERGGPEAIIYKILERGGPESLKLAFKMLISVVFLQIFSKYSTKRGAQAPWAPPLNPPLHVFIK